MSRHVVFVQKAPTPYNDHLFAALHGDPRIDLDVAYLWRETAGRPWKSVLGAGYPSHWMRPRCGVDHRWLRRAVRDRDSLYVVGDWAHAATVGLVLARVNLGLPVALRVDTPQEHLARRQPKKWLRQQFLRRLLPRVDRIFATSQPAFDVLSQMGAATPQFVDFPFYVPLTPLVETSSAAWLAERQRLRALVGCGSDDIVFAMVGTLIPKKGMDLGLRALARLHGSGDRKVGLLIAGDGPERAALVELARALGIANAVHILGWLEPEPLEQALLAADAMVHAARYDPFPVAVLDAMRLGRAVIGADTCGSVQARVVPKQNGWVFPAGDVAALEEAMAVACADSRTLRRWGAAARRTAEQWPVTRGVETVWQQLVELRIPERDVRGADATCH